MNGKLHLKAFGGKRYTVIGGAYQQRLEGTRGVCLRHVKFNETCDVVMTWPDFGVPEIPHLIAALDETLDLIIAGHPVYVGCGAGIGRTGTFLACLAKLFGEKDPISYVRANYLHIAIETTKQEDLVRNIHFPYRLKMKVIWARAKHYMDDNTDLTDLGGVEWKKALRRNY